MIFFYFILWLLLIDERFAEMTKDCPDDEDCEWRLMSMLHPSVQQDLNNILEKYCQVNDYQIPIRIKKAIAALRSTDNDYRRYTYNIVSLNCTQSKVCKEIPSVSVHLITIR